jgi:hypothetical protein
MIIGERDNKVAHNAIAGSSVSFSCPLLKQHLQHFAPKLFILKIAVF